MGWLTKSKINDVLQKMLALTPEQKLNLPFGNREIIFSKGVAAGGGTATGLCRPAWMTKVPGTEDVSDTN